MGWSLEDLDGPWRAPLPRGLWNRLLQLCNAGQNCGAVRTAITASLVLLRHQCFPAVNVFLEAGVPQGAAFWVVNADISVRERKFQLRWWE